ncbi:MAG: FAD-binding oxidoreductase [Desulfurococcales archaeon]|nr:FAD-binding oxidoreductase [Desulfurococcales archaeon]
MEAVSVIGAGVAGLSAAIEMARQGYRVRVYEQALLKYSAATRSAGIVVTIMRGSLLRYALDSVRLYESLDPGLVRRVEALWISEDRDCMERVVGEHRSLGLRSRLLDGPPSWLSARPSESYAVIETFIVDAGRVLPLLLQKAERLGVEVVEEAVSGVPGRYRTGGERLEGIVVVAAGPWTPSLVPSLRSELVVYKCQAASVEGARPPMPVEDDALDYYIVPVSPSRSNIGDGPNPLLDDPLDGYATDMEAVYDVLERYAERNPSAWEARVIQAWAAPCAVGREGLPIVKAIRRDTIVFAGFNGAGLTLAPGMAKLLPGLLRGFTPPSLPAPRRPPKTRGVLEPYDVC